MRQSSLYYLTAILVFSFTIYGGHGLTSADSSETVTVTDRGLFVIADNYPDNSSNPAVSGVVMNELVAGQWGNWYEVTVTGDDLHVLGLKTYDHFGANDETILLNVKFTIGGNVTVLLGLGTSSLDGIYTEVTRT